MKSKLQVNLNAEENTQLLELPDELLVNVFRFFSQRERASMGQSCKKFLSICMPKYNFSEIVSEKTLFDVKDVFIKKMCISPDGSMIATINADTDTNAGIIYSIGLYDCEHQEFMILHFGNDDSYQQIAFSLDSKYIIVSRVAGEDSDCVEVWDPKSKKLVNSYEHSLYCSAPICALHDKKKFMIIYDEGAEGVDCLLKTYNFLDRTEETILNLDEEVLDETRYLSEYVDVAFSKNQEKFLVNNHENKTLSIYNLKTKAKIFHTDFDYGVFEDRPSKRSFNFISNDTQLIYIEPGNICIMGIDNNFEMKVEVDGLGETAGPIPYSLSKDEKFIAIPRDSFVDIIDLERKVCIKTISCSATVKDVKFTPDNKSLLISESQSLKRYQFEPLELKQYFTPEHSQSTFNFIKQI